MGGTPLVGQVSQSAQWAVSTNSSRYYRFIHLVYFQPFNRAYIWDNTSDNEVLADPSISILNTFKGSATQQATSVVTDTNQLCYELVETCFSIYGFEASNILFCLLYSSDFLLHLSTSQVSLLLQFLQSITHVFNTILRLR